MQWKDMPPLAALRAFEAASRNLSFSGAARDLNVTHAAVAQQVRALEAHLGLSLIFRDGRGLALTVAGTDLASGLRDGFGTIEAALAALARDRISQPLRVTMTPNFATQWLMPRLGGFWAKHPDIPLSLHPDLRPLDLRRERMDLAIRSGQGDWPGLDAEQLLSKRYIVVGAPSLLAGRATLSLAEMAAMPWLISEDWPEQRTWIRSIGLPTETFKELRFPNGELSFPAARQGYGLMLETHALLGDDLKAGRLCAVHTVDAPAVGYHLVTLPGPQRPDLRLFIRWLKSVA